MKFWHALQWRCSAREASHRRPHSTIRLIRSVWTRQTHSGAHSDQQPPGAGRKEELGQTANRYREGGGTPFQYSCLENLRDRGAWWAAVHEVTKSQTQLSDFTFTFHFPALEKEMATHSSVLAWRIPGTGAPGGLPSVGSHRVGHDWSDLAAAAATCFWIFYDGIFQTCTKVDGRV